MDPSGSRRLEKIEAALDQLFRQHLALMEAMEKMYRQGGERLDQIDEKLDRLLEP